MLFRLKKAKYLMSYQKNIIEAMDEWITEMAL